MFLEDSACGPAHYYKIFCIVSIVLNLISDITDKTNYQSACYYLIKYIVNAISYIGIYVLLLWLCSKEYEQIAWGVASIPIFFSGLGLLLIFVAIYRNIYSSVKDTLDNTIGKINTNISFDKTNSPSMLY